MPNLLVSWVPWFIGTVVFGLYLIGFSLLVAASDDLDKPTVSDGRTARVLLVLCVICSFVSIIAAIHPH